MQPFFGIAAAVIGLIGFGPYLRDILRGKTKPERATWWVWLIIAAVAFSQQFVAGARWTLVGSASGLLILFVIALLSISRGYGRFQTKDKAAIALAIVGLALGTWLENPLLALIIVLMIDLVGTWLTLVKTWHAPDTETLSAWVFSFVACICVLLAIDEWTAAISIYPIYNVFMNLAMVLVIPYRRPRVAKK